MLVLVRARFRVEFGIISGESMPMMLSALGLMLQDHLGGVQRGHYTTRVENVKARANSMSAWVELGAE